MSADFYRPDRGLTFLIILLLVFFIVRSHKLRKAFAAILKTNKSLDRSHSFHAPMNRYIKEGLFVLALLFIALALMRPRWGEKERRRKVQSVDVCIALDLSQSMLAEDMTPNRLKFAKREITLLLEKLDSYRVSLVGFAGGAFVAAPLTSDLDAVADLLSPLNTDFVSMPSTFIDGALMTCAESLGYKDITSRDDDEEKGNSTGVILLVTDGDDDVAIDSDIIKGFKRRKIPISSYLIGKESAVQIPLRDQMGNVSSFVKDPTTGAVASTQLTTKKVKMLSDETGGKIYTASQIAEFATVFAGDLKKFEAKSREEGVEIEKEEQFQIPLLIGILLLLIELFLTETGEVWPQIKKRFLLVPLFLVPPPAHALSLMESLRNNWGVFLFNRGKLKDAQDYFEQNVESSPENSRFLFNWTSAKLNKIEKDLQQLMKEGKADPKDLAQSPSAVDAAEIAKLINLLAQKESDPLWKKKWYYQLGNAHELSGQMGPAIDAYYEALKEPKNSDLDPAAKHNLARLLKDNSQSGGSGSGGQGGGGGKGGQGDSDKDDPSKGQAQKKQPQDYKGQNFTKDQVKQILQNVGSEERNVMKKKSREEAQKKAKEWGEGDKRHPW